MNSHRCRVKFPPDGASEGASMVFYNMANCDVMEESIESLNPRRHVVASSSSSCPLAFAVLPGNSSSNNNGFAPNGGDGYDDDDIVLPEHIAFWSGKSFNAGEDSMSRLIWEQRKELKSFIFHPTSHKGGRMVRPQYWMNDRTLTVTFPSLRTLGYYEDIGTPLDARWVVPNLETLYVFQGHKRASRTVNPPGGKLEKSMLLYWNVDSDDEEVGNNGGGRYGRPRRTRRRRPGLARRAWEECPNLKEIICGIPDFSQPSLEFQIVRRLVPPCPLPNEVLRLLNRAVPKADEAACPMAKLPQGVMDLVLSFCHSAEWQIIDYDHGPPAGE